MLQFSRQAHPTLASGIRHAKACGTLLTETRGSGRKIPAGTRHERGRTPPALAPSAVLREKFWRIGGGLPDAPARSFSHPHRPRRTHHEPGDSTARAGCMPSRVHAAGGPGSAGSVVSQRVVRHRVPRAASSVSRLWMGDPSSVRFAAGDGCAGASGSRVSRSARSRSSSKSQGRRAARRRRFGDLRLTLCLRLRHAPRRGK